VAWRFCAYDAYDREPAKAILALEKRCAGFSEKQYQNAFEKSVALYEAVQDLLRANRDRVWAAERAGEPYHKLFNDELAERFPGFRRSTLGSMVGMSFYYWHMR
jgi:hypothetical protein